MIQVHKKLKERPKTSCLYYAGGSNFKNAHQIRCSLTTYDVCDPDTCAWYLSQEMADASYEKARQNYIKKYGRDDYYRLGYGPKKNRMNPKKDPDAKEEKA